MATSSVGMVGRQSVWSLSWIEPWLGRFNTPAEILLRCLSYSQESSLEEWGGRRDAPTLRDLPWLPYAAPAHATARFEIQKRPNSIYKILKMFSKKVLRWTEKLNCFVCDLIGVTFENEVLFAKDIYFLDEGTNTPSFKVIFICLLYFLVNVVK